jgi:hypothetical protein
MPCDKIEYMLGNETLSTHPECEPFFSGKNPKQHGSVRADLMGAESAAEAGAMLDMSFGPSVWMALAIHMILCELYVSVPRSYHIRDND